MSRKINFLKLQTTAPSFSLKRSGSEKEGGRTSNRKRISNFLSGMSLFSVHQSYLELQAIPGKLE